MPCMRSPSAAYSGSYQFKNHANFGLMAPGTIQLKYLKTWKGPNYLETFVVPGGHIWMTL